MTSVAHVHRHLFHPHLHLLHFSFLSKQEVEVLQDVCGGIPSPAPPSPRRCQPSSPFLAKLSSEKDSFCLLEPERSSGQVPDLCDLMAIGIFPSRQKALLGTICGWLLYDHESGDHAPTLVITVLLLFCFV